MGDEPLPTGEELTEQIESGSVDFGELDLSSTEIEAVNTPTVTIRGWRWGGLDQYEIGGPENDEIVSVHASRVNTDTGEYEHHQLEGGDRVGFKADVGVPDAFEYVGNAPIRDWSERETGDVLQIEKLYAVWATPDGEEWATTILSEGEE